MARQVDYEIRMMKVEEVDRVSELVRSLQRYQKMQHCPRLPNGQDFERELTHTDESGHQLANNFGTFTAVAVDKNRLNEQDFGYIVGYLMYMQSYSIVEGRKFYITSFFIDENYRRHGLGKKFIEFLQVHANSVGCESFDVPFMNNNFIGQKFYKSYGAYLVNDDYYLMKKDISQLLAAFNSGGHEIGLR